MTSQIALVTGAGRGIGQAIAHRLADAGYFVIASDRKGGLAEETIGQIGPERGRAVELDVTDRTAVAAVVNATVAEFGGLHLAVSNAMWIRYAPLSEVSESDVDRMVDVGVKGPLWMAQALQEPMRRQGGGSIVNIASVAALLSTPNAAVYSAVKGALVSLTRQLAGDLGTDNIRVNAIAPGTIDTPGARVAMSDEARDHRRNRAPLGRLGLPADIAEAVLYLGGPASSFVTGQLLTVDGGITARM
ncbi:MAG TPA: SDR family oxidoreductase [Trebonia sp.]|nr:SDR family oxidoreductase [Trebonia sp.]